MVGGEEGTGRVEGGEDIPGLMVLLLDEDCTLTGNRLQPIGDVDVVGDHGKHTPALRGMDHFVWETPL